MGCFKKLYNPDYKEPKTTWNGWTNSSIDIHDYWDAIDEGYLTYKQFIDYNILKIKFKEELNDDEIWSMTNSNNLII